jgi:tryptophan synthase alpha chain
VNRISEVFKTNKKVLIPYITVGYPSQAATLKIVPLLAKLGCNIIELGIPFSDPLADGATIQKASFAALHNNVNPKKCLEMARQIRNETDVPLVFMSYYNPIYNFGLNKFVDSCVASGISGLIVPDLPPDEGEELEQITQRIGIDLIYLLAPTSTSERIQLVARHSSGFIYLVSVAGVTGTREKMPEELEAFVRNVRNDAHQPLCVGFGISSPEHAREVSRYADGVIVGSRLVQIMEETDWEKKVELFIGDLKKAIDSP